MKKVDLLNGHLSELNHIKAEIAAMYNDLKSIKKKLEKKGEIHKAVILENSKLKEHVTELEKSLH